MFIAIEGIDGAGKTTLARGIFNLLSEEGYPVYLTREPTDSMENYTGDGVELFLKFTINRYAHQREIEYHINNGEIVLCDRYIRSSFAYQFDGITDFFGDPDKAWRWMEEVSEIITLRPDIQVYVDVDVRTAMDRISMRGVRNPGFEDEQKLRRVREIYRKFRWDVTVDGSKDRDVMISEAFGSIIERIRRIRQ
ncbi:dTMP kinase [Thermoplasma sp.]|uniref:dTMP kinase n=1 Tax=Thermoplasma sp. TaxID=1973142 RepID=UPI00126FFCD5|nr:dTMP kinase [Thermoplasma sp.]KAA8922341.1 MAG: dTMP kinase [Thermoplasma sp.]